MEQVCDGYSKKSLMGNWYEERYAPIQPYRTFCRDKAPAQKVTEVTFVSNNNQIEQLTKTTRFPAWNTQGVIPQDKFNELRTTNQTQYDPIYLDNYHKLGDQRSIVKTTGKNVTFPENAAFLIQTSKQNAYKILNNENIQNVIGARLDKHDPNHFASKFKSHDQTYNTFYGITTYQKSFQRPQLNATAQFENRQMTIEQNLLESIQQKEKSIMPRLVAEQYRNKADPKDNTEIQRTWINKKDQGVQYFKTSKPYNPQQFFDNANSLQLDESYKAIQQKMIDQKGFGHIKSDVTTVYNKRISNR